MSSIKTLAKQLKSVISGGGLQLPNSAVSEVQLTGFINDVIQSQNVKVTKATVKLSGTSVTLTGSISLFNVVLDLKWVFSQPAGGDITWTFSASTASTAKINDVLDHFLSSVPTLPASVTNLNLTKIAITTTYDSHAKHYSLQLNATTAWGETDLIVTYNNGTWGAGLGIALNSSVSLEDISSNLSVFDDLTFSKSAVVIADMDDPDITLAGIKGVIKGIEFRSTLSLAPNAPGSSPIVMIANELATSLSGTEIEVTIDLTASSAKLTADIAGPFAFPGYEKLQLSSVDFSIDTTPAASLSGTLDIPVSIPGNPGVNSISVTGGISFTYSSGTGTIAATLSSDTKIIEPFKIPGFTLLDIGFGVDADFGVETGAGLTFAGGFELGSQQLDTQFAMTLEIAEELPDPTLLYINTKNLSLPTLFDALISSSVTLPSVLSGFKFNQLVLYWCNKAQQIPVGPLKDSTCQIGYGFNAGIDFWGFNTYAALMVSTGTGIAGQASIDPISLWNGNITITGNGKGGNGVAAGGAYFDFDTSKESFDASLNANILGLSTQDSAAISRHSLAINMKSNFGFLQDSIAVSFTSLDHMSFKSTIDIGINASPVIKLGGMTLGTIDVNTKVSGSLSVVVKGSGLSAKVRGAFSWNGYSFSFHFELATDINHLSDLASAIASKMVKEAAAIFGTYFSDVTNYLSAFAKGLLRDGDFVLDVLKNAYGESIAEILVLLEAMQQGVHVDGKPSFDIDVSQSVPGVSFHIDTGKIIDTHADALFVDIHADVGISHNFSTPSFDVTLLDVHAGGHFDMQMPPAIHADASSPHFDQGLHVDAGIAGGGLHLSGKAGVDMKASLKNIHLHGKFDASGHVGVHADVVGLGKHADTGVHADVSF